MQAEPIFAVRGRERLISELGSNDQTGFSNFAVPFATIHSIYVGFAQQVRPSDKSFI